MGKVLTIREAMGLLVAESEGPLDQVKHFERHETRRRIKLYCRYGPPWV